MICNGRNPSRLCEPFESTLVSMVEALPLSLVVAIDVAEKNSLVFVPKKTGLVLLSSESKTFGGVSQK